MDVGMFQTAVPLLIQFVLKAVGALDNVQTYISNSRVFADTIQNFSANPYRRVDLVAPLGPALAVRPYCKNEHYWQVYFDTNRAIREAFGEAGFPAAEQPIVVRTDGRVAAAAARVA